MTGNKYISGGAFAVPRKIFHSGLWLKHPLYFKIFIWFLGRASYEDHEKNGFIYKRGEFVTTYDEIIKATAYHHNHKHIIPTLKQVRIIIKWLVDEGMIVVQPIMKINANPLKPELGLTGADPLVRTGAYVGIKIIVINYDGCQDLENYKGRHKGRPASQQGHNNNKDTIRVINKENIHIPENQFVLPSWVPAEPWEAFIEMRVKMKAPLTEKAKILLIGKLQKLAEEGGNVEEIINQSISNSYRGFFHVQKGFQKKSEPDAGNQTRSTKYSNLRTISFDEGGEQDTGSGGKTDAE
jgi:hypothetical protein